MSIEAFCVEMRVSKDYPYKLRGLNVILLCVLLIFGFLGPMNMLVRDQSGPLLLNSGLTEANEAEFRVIIWFESGMPPENLRRSLPQEGWEWQETYRNTPESSAYTLSGYKIIEPKEERKLFPWFQRLSNQIKELGGIVYLDERVAEGMDIANYSIQQGIIPLQWSLAGSTISVTGLKRQVYPSVQAGLDSVNIQVISQAYNGKGKTALAIPVLLEEF